MWRLGDQLPIDPARTARVPVATNVSAATVQFLQTHQSDYPGVSVQTITLEGDANGAPHPEPSAYAGKFSGPYSHRTIDGGIGHNLPQEAPEPFAQAVIDVATQ